MDKAPVRATLLMVLACVAALMVLLGGTSAEGLEADESEYAATVVIPVEMLGSPIPGREGVAWDRAVPWVGVYADGEFCIGAQTFGARDDFVLQLGGPEQPAACGTAGSVLTFTRLNLADDKPDLEFELRYQLELGGTFVLDSFAPLPPPLGSAGPIPTDFATVVYPADQFADQVAASEGADRGVIVLANGRRCGTIDFSTAQERDASGNAVLTLGGEGQPAACRTPGAIVTFRQTARPDEDLVGSFFLEAGSMLVFENIMPAPPDTGDHPALDPPAPPAAGGGAETATSASSTRLVIGGLLLALVAGSAFWLVRRSARTSSTR